jgi:DHA1 family tetracycline resistance protein-like MFS transporter
MNNLFAFFTRPGGDVYFPGAAMLLGAVLTLISVAMARRTMKKYAAVRGAGI